MMQSDYSDPFKQRWGPPTFTIGNSNDNHLPIQFIGEYHEGNITAPDNNNTCPSTMGNCDLRLTEQQYTMGIKQEIDPQHFWQQKQEEQQEPSQQHSLPEQSLGFSMGCNTLQQLLQLQMQQQKIDETLLQLRQYPVAPNIAAGVADGSTVHSQHLDRITINASRPTLGTGLQSPNGLDPIFAIPSPYVPPKTSQQSHAQPFQDVCTEKSMGIQLNYPLSGDSMPHYSESKFLSKFQKVMKESEMSPGETPLPSNYHPDEFDVACGRGKGSYSRPGNRRFRDIVNRFVDEYIASHRKDRKSDVMNKIIATVTSQNGGKCRFVRQDSKTGEWFEIGTELVRDKVGHAMREAINVRDRKLNKQIGGARAKSNKKNASGR